MASSHNGREVVRYIKSLPTKFTNLSEPKSMYLEDLVRRVEAERLPAAARRPGSQGFHALLTASLQVGPAGLLAQQPVLLIALLVVARLWFTRRRLDQGVLQPTAGSCFWSRRNLHMRLSS